MFKLDKGDSIMNKDYLDKLILDFEEDVSNLALGKKANKKGFIGFTELE